jgi:hypothetical protein
MGKSLWNSRPRLCLSRGGRLGRILPSLGLIPFSVFGFRFSVKKTRIISKLKLKFVALETELGISELPKADSAEILERLPKVISFAGARRAVPGDGLRAPHAVPLR